MFQKNCYRCRRPSFSSTEEGLWICPNCGEDLTAQKSHHPESSKKAGTFPKDASAPFLYTHSRPKKERQKPVSGRSRTAGNRKAGKNGSSCI